MMATSIDCSTYYLIARVKKESFTSVHKDETGLRFLNFIPLLASHSN